MATVIRTVDGCAVPPRSLQENLRRARDFDWCVAKIGEDLPEMLGVNPDLQAFEYLNVAEYQDYNLGLTADNPSADVLGRRVAAYLAARDLHGVLLDVPFMHPGGPMAGAKVCVAIQGAIGPRRGIVNFGDSLTWMRQFPALNQAVDALRWLMPVHQVEAAVDLSKPFNRDHWRSVLATAEAMLLWSKTVILGIYDPGGLHRDLATALAFSAVMASAKPERLLMFYKSNNSPVTGDDYTSYCLNPALEFGRSP